MSNDEDAAELHAGQKQQNALDYKTIDALRFPTRQSFWSFPCSFLQQTPISLRYTPFLFDLLNRNAVGFRTEKPKDREPGLVLNKRAVYHVPEFARRVVEEEIPSSETVDLLLARDFDFTTYQCVHVRKRRVRSVGQACHIGQTGTSELTRRTVMLSKKAIEEKCPATP